LRERPGSEKAAARIAETKQILAEAYTETAYQALEQGDYFGAIDSAAAAVAQWPTSTAVQRMVIEVSNTIQDYADRSAEEKQWAEAMDYYQALYDKLPSQRPMLENKIQGVREDWAQKLGLMGKSALAKGHEGEALLCYSKAAELKLAPGYVSKRDSLRQKLLLEHAYKVAITSKNPRNPGFVAVKDRLTSADWIPNLRIVSPSKDVQADATATINFGPVSFRTDVTTSTRSVEYVSGTRQVDNPRYLSLQDDVLDQERRVLREEEDVADLEDRLARAQERVAREGDTPGVSTGAEQDVSRYTSSLRNERDNLARERRRLLSLKEDLAREPQLIEEDVYSILDYPVNTHTLVGSTSLDVYVAHADGRAAKSESFRPSVTASDDQHAAYPQAGIFADPLNLPSENTLIPQLYSRGEGDAAFAIISSLNDHRAQPLERAIAAPSDAERLDLYVIYILMDPRDVAPEVEADIMRLRGVPDATRVVARPEQ